MNVNEKFYVFAVLAILFLFILIYVFARNPTRARVNAFESSLRAEYGDLLSSLCVEVRERTSDAAVPYTDRLIIVRPLQWYIYSPDGLTFYYFTNQVAADCPAERISSVQYRLMSDAEHAEHSTQVRLRVRCLNYTMNTLIRVFAASSVKRTDIDLSQNQQLVKNITIESLLDTLLDLGVI